jgi:hypothetical protein
MSGLPDSVNTGAFANIPVVTSLLAQLSTATVLVPLAMQGADTKIKAAHIGRIPWSLLDQSVVAGVLATIFFITATVLALQAHSRNFDVLSRDQQNRWLQIWEADVEKEKLEKTRNSLISHYNELRAPIFESTQVAWHLGLCAFLISLGSLSYHVTPVAYPLTLGFSVLVAIAALRREAKTLRLTGVIALAVIAFISIGSLL